MYMNPPAVVNGENINLKPEVGKGELYFPVKHPEGFTEKDMLDWGVFDNLFILTYQNAENAEKQVRVVYNLSGKLLFSSAFRVPPLRVAPVAPVAKDPTVLERLKSLFRWTKLCFPADA